MLVQDDDLCLAKALKSVVGCRQPSVLTYTTKFMQERVDFLVDNGMPMEAIAKAVVSHPQVCPPTAAELSPHINTTDYLNAAVMLCCLGASC